MVKQNTPNGKGLYKLNQRKLRLVSTTDEPAIVQHRRDDRLVGLLENVLTSQIGMLRKYDIDGALVLAEEAEGITQTLGQQGTLDKPKYSDARERIDKLYKNIGQIIVGKKQEVYKALEDIREGVKQLMR